MSSHKSIVHESSNPCTTQFLESWLKDPYYPIGSLEFYHMSILLDGKNIRDIQLNQEIK